MIENEDSQLAAFLNLYRAVTALAGYLSVLERSDIELSRLNDSHLSIIFTLSVDQLKTREGGGGVPLEL